MLHDLLELSLCPIISVEYTRAGTLTSTKGCNVHNEGVRDKEICPVPSRHPHFRVSQLQSSTYYNPTVIPCSDPHLQVATLRLEDDESGLRRSPRIVSKRVRSAIDQVLCNHCEILKTVAHIFCVGTHTHTHTHTHAHTHTHTHTHTVS